MAHIRPVDPGDFSKESQRASRQSSISFKDILDAKLNELRSSQGERRNSETALNEAKLVNFELNTLISSVRSGEINVRQIRDSLDDLLTRLVKVYSGLEKQ